MKRKPTEQRKALNEAVPKKLLDIVISQQQLRHQASAGLMALQFANTPPTVFVRAGELVRLLVDETGKRIISPFREASLRGRLTRVANFYRLAGNGSRIDIAPPVTVVKDILALGKWDFPGLAAIVEVPVLTPTDELLTSPGTMRRAGFIIGQPKT